MDICPLFNLTLISMTKDMLSNKTAMTIHGTSLNEMLYKNVNNRRKEKEVHPSDVCSLIAQITLECPHVIYYVQQGTAMFVTSIECLLQNSIFRFSLSDVTLLLFAVGLQFECLK